jgi:hypothetical protein
MSQAGADSQLSLSLAEELRDRRQDVHIRSTNIGKAPPQSRESSVFAAMADEANSGKLSTM